MSSKAILFFAAALISTSTVFANQECAEGQITARVTSIKTITTDTCVVNVSTQSISSYASSSVCPLDEMEVVNSGIDVGLKNSHACTYQEGEILSGYLSVDEQGAILLDSYNN